MLDDLDPNQTPVTRPTRRRRSASRPAGPPVQTPQTETVPESGQQEPITRAAAEVSPATDPVEVPAAPKRPARRRATRAQGSAVAEPAAAPVSQDPVVEAPVADGPVADTSATEAPVADTPAAQQPVAEVPAAAETERPARGRRTRRSTTRQAPAAAPAAVEEPQDELDARLEAARAEADNRRQRGLAPEIAEPFSSPERALQSLAASIAGMSQPQAATTAEDAAVEADEDADDQDAVDQDAETTAAQSDEVTDDQATDAAGLDEGDSDEGDSAEDESGDEDADSDSTDDEGDRGGRRRRRRRGGRRRRRGGDDEDESTDADDSDESAQSGDANQSHPADPGSGEAEESSSEDADAAGSEDDVPDTGRRRRRRRRRRGEDTGSAEDDPSDVVVRVREPRRGRSASSSDEVTGIEGSTRMAAKKIRRQEGRAAGRRRAPILSESEFLARREAVERRMVIRQGDDFTQLAVIEDGVLVEHYVDRDSSASMIGNIYLGKVQNVLPGMEAAFIDIGRGRNAVLYAGEVDWDAFGATGDQRKVEKVFKSGQVVLVQVSKDPVGAKGARLTSHISIPGRYIVYSPGGHLSGISRKLADTERHRLKEILGTLIDEKASVIVRTAAEGVSEDELVRDVNRLKAQWEVIEKKVKQGSAPQQLYSEPDLTVRIVRDLFTEDFAELLVQGNGGADDTYDAIEGYVTHVAPHLQERLTRWDVEERGDIFAAHKLDEQISKALERKVFLPSGGSLIIDRTEAMTVVDVNTGRFTGTQGNLEATVTSNNLEAAEEIVRQLRLRDIGGIIVIDFIDMVLPSNRELLLRRLVECLGRDRTRHQVSEVTSLGLVQMTRKKIGTGLAEAFTEQCEHCGGRGYHRSEEPVASQAPADGGDRRGGQQGQPGNGGNRRSGGGRRRRGGSSDAD